MINFGQICDILSTSATRAIKYWRRKTKILQPRLYFWGFFSGMVVFFNVFCSGYKEKSWNLRCVVLSRKDAGFKSSKGNSKQKLSFYKKTYANSAILYRLLKGFSHSSIVLTIFILLSWFQNKSFVTLDRSFILASLIYVAVWSNQSTSILTSYY